MPPLILSRYFSEDDRGGAVERSLDSRVLEIEVQRQGLTLSQSRLAELQPLAERNSVLAKKVIQRERLGIRQDVEHTPCVVIMPVIVAELVSFAVVRFIGMGTGNQGLYVTGVSAW